MANSNPLWNVNKYKSEFESEEHWQLRKKFMETHIDKFPEDKLVCLAQVFFNIEFLGCRYPEKTMKDIAELSKGVADEHRENQKGKLKRTFVQASDAAGAKIKGSGAQPLIEPQNKILKTSLETVSFVCPAHVNLTKPLPQPSTSGEFPGLIIFENCNRLGEVEACPINILTHSIQKDGMCNTIKFSHIGRTCTIVINGKVLASDEGSSHKEAKVNAAVKGLKLLRKTCYTIQAKRAFFSNNPSITKDGKVSESDAPLPEDNIGNRMMQKMGWGGSGLGKSQQGIQAPIQASPQIMNRAGFGCANQRDLENEFRTVFQDYIKSSSDSDLVFSPDFTPEERKTLHKNISGAEGKGDDDSGDDLFGSDTERDLKADTDDIEDTTNSEQSETELCFMCCKLRLLTGEESGDDVYDTMWNTGADTTGLVQQDSEHYSGRARENKESGDEGTDDKLCGNGDDSLSISGQSSTYNELQMSTDRRNVCPSLITPSENNTLRTDSVSSNPSDYATILKTNEEKENSLEKIKIILPDGSYKRIPLDKILAIEGLRDFTEYSAGKTALAYSHFTTIKDLQTNAAVRELFSDFLLPYRSPQVDEGSIEHNNKSPVVEETINVPDNDASSHQAYINTALTTVDPHTNSVPVETTMLENNANECQVNTNTTSVTFKQGDKWKKRKKRVFLPDGSFKRLSLEVFQASKALRDIFETQEGISNEDFIKHRVLRTLFFDYWNKIKNTFSSGPDHNPSSHVPLHDIDPDLITRRCKFNRLKYDEYYKLVAYNSDNDPILIQGNLLLCTKFPKFDFEKKPVGQGWHLIKRRSEPKNLQVSWVQITSGEPVSSYSRRTRTLLDGVMTSEASNSPVSENNSLQKHLLEPGPDSVQPNLESHINSTTVTTVHSVMRPVAEEHTPDDNLSSNSA